MSKTYKNNRARKKKAEQPRYGVIVEALRHRLIDGRLAAGVKVPPLMQLANEFKVSTITVRKALDVLEKEGSVYSVPNVGAFVSPTYPTPAARAQVTVAFAAVDLGNSFEMEVARGVEAGCRQRGWGMQVFHAHDDPQVEAHNLSQLVESPARGAIILPTCAQENFEILFNLKSTRFPFVLVDRSILGLTVDLVESDHEKGAYVATEYLLQHGHQHVLILFLQSQATSVAAWMRGYEQALIAQELEPQRTWKIRIDPMVATRGNHQGRRWLGGYEAILPVLKKVKPPVAILATNTDSVLGVLQACQELELRIPRDVSIISFGDSDVFQASNPPITAITQNPLEIGRTAVDVLERRLRTGCADRECEHVVVDVNLLQRKSVISTFQHPGVESSLNGNVLVLPFPGRVAMPIWPFQIGHKEAAK